MKRSTRPLSNRFTAAVPASDDQPSGNDVRNYPIGQLLDLVLERQLALFHPGNLELVAIAGQPQQLDLFLETPMLRLEECQDFLRIVVIHALILQEDPVIVTHPAVIGKALGGPAKPFDLLATKCLFRDLFTELSRVSQRKEIDRWTRPMPRQSHPNMLLFTRLSMLKSTALTRTWTC